MYERVEKYLAERLQALLNPRMLSWLVLTVLLGLFLWFIAGRASAVGSLAVTMFNMSALGYLGYRASNALEGGKRPHELFEAADAIRKGPMADYVPTPADLERAWQLEQLGNSMLVRRFTLVSACVLGSTFMKF